MTNVHTRVFGTEVIVTTFDDRTVAAFSTETWDFVTWTGGINNPSYERAVYTELANMARRVQADQKKAAT